MIPPSLLEAHKRLCFDDRGVMRGIRISEFHAVGPYHCLSAWGESMPDIRGQWMTPKIATRVGDATLYEYPSKMEVDPVLRTWPNLGQQVWQITQSGQLRTSRVLLVTAGLDVFGVLLKVAGPNPGIPIGGDSGSVCWVRWGDQWKVLGMVSYGGRCEIAIPGRKPSMVWSGPVLIPNESSKLNTFADDASMNVDWIDPDTNTTIEPTKPPAMSIPVIPDISKPDQVGAMNSTPDGVPDVLLEVQSSIKIVDIREIIVRGAGTDEWRWPSNNANWAIWRHEMQDDRLVLRFNQSVPTGRYTVIINSVSGQSFGMVVAPMQPAGTVDVTIPTPTPTDPSEVDSMKKEIAELKTQCAKLAMDNADLRGRISAYKNAFNNL